MQLQLQLNHHCVKPQYHEWPLKRPEKYAVPKTRVIASAYKLYV